MNKQEFRSNTLALLQAAPIVTFRDAKIIMTTWNKEFPTERVHRASELREAACNYVKSNVLSAKEGVDKIVDILYTRYIQE